MAPPQRLAGRCPLFCLAARRLADLYSMHFDIGHYEAAALFEAPSGASSGRPSRLAPAGRSREAFSSPSCQYCPDGWTQSGVGCVAPASYRGPCGRFSAFYGYTTQPALDGWLNSCGDVTWKKAPSCYVSNSELAINPRLAINRTPGSNDASNDWYLAGLPQQSLGPRDP